LYINLVQPNVLLIISFFVLSILARILISIIARWLTKLLEEESALRFINRLLGFTVGILKGLLIVLVVFWVMRFLSSWIGGIENLVNNYIAPDNPEFGIARWIYNNNFIDFIFDRLLNKESIELVGK
jgi:hypothetical protein